MWHFVFKAPFFPFKSMCLSWKLELEEDQVVTKSPITPPSLAFNDQKGGGGGGWRLSSRSSPPSGKDGCGPVDLKWSSIPGVLAQDQISMGITIEWQPLLGFLSMGRQMWLKSYLFTLHKNLLFCLGTKHNFGIWTGPRNQAFPMQQSGPFLSNNKPGPLESIWTCHHIPTLYRWQSVFLPEFPEDIIPFTWSYFCTVIIFISPKDL